MKKFVGGSCLGSPTTTTVRNVLREITALTGWTAERPIDLQEIAKVFAVVPPSPEADGGLIMRLVDPQSFTLIDQFVSDVQEYESLWESCCAAFITPEATLACSPSRLCEMEALLGPSATADATVHELKPLADKKQREAESWRAVAKLIQQIELLETQGVALQDLGNVVRRVMYQSIARLAISRHSGLAQFTGERHEGFRKQFRELDHKLLRLRHAKIATELLRRRVDPGNDLGPKSDWTQLALISNEVGKQKRHIPIRTLMDRSGVAVQQLMPCFMMSPLSVAQFLKPGSVSFDLVIMDEASQLRPEDAIGAIARSKQISVASASRVTRRTRSCAANGSISPWLLAAS